VVRQYNMAGVSGRAKVLNLMARKQKKKKRKCWRPIIPFQGMLSMTYDLETSH
jgi:hypothetical protein